MGSHEVVFEFCDYLPPKAPTRRAAPGPAPARRPSAVSQSQTQSTKASLERDATEQTRRPSATPAISVEPELDDNAPIAVAPQEPAAAAPKATATAISIPHPKRKPSISTPTLQQATVPAPTPAFAPAPKRGRAPSLTHDVPTSPVSYAKKTSEITKGRRRTSVLATSSSSQGVVPTTEGASETPAPSLDPSTPDPSQAAAKGKRKASKASTEADGSEKAKKVRRRKREPTPEGAERVEILPNVVKMSELCKDLKTGRKSKRETELRKLEIEEQERKWKAQEEGTNGTPVKKTAEPENNQEDRLPPPKPQAGPVMRIVNGEIVLDTASLEVDRHADAARSAGDLEDVVENQLTRKINQATYGKRSKTETWDEELTDLFYRGLRMFGTDFMVISKLFPGRSRRQIKLKFNNEERRDPQRIKDTLLGPRETIDIKTYSEMTQQTFDDPKVIQRELDDEKKRIEDEHEKEKQLQEELMRNPTGTGKDENAEGDKPPTKVKGRGKKAKAQSGGTEEVLGSIDDIPMA
ncbi:uncharacterized protein N7477_004693 [Penicillium maclennaniae]|uniref:uncharacterized protein n=1 Tax=Penicillium maclennaniae TaxID=1343394 RepID=UPI0025406ED5|nr:uncharacterized protein N7477_004693 [Penicillium maclennaniae]KAJ5674759.1 hypothetical protein N7477_004693 [Penicillium maclennaniae]